MWEDILLQKMFNFEEFKSVGVQRKNATAT